MDILTVTLNPTVDLDSHTPQVRPNVKLRCAEPVLDPGGGGVNVSRAIQQLGGGSRALAALGGAMGEVLRGLLQREGLDLVALAGAGETRQSLSVTDDADGAQYRFIFPGPHWGLRDMDRALEAIADAAPSKGFVVLSGSLPQGVPSEFAADMVWAAASRGAQVIADTSGRALAVLGNSEAPPLHVLRMDGEEAEILAGRPMPDPAASADLGADMVRRGAADVVVMARGPEGSVLVRAEERLFCRAAHVPVRSKTGAGDSFVGGFTLALSRGQSYGEALQRGVAAASAAVMTDATKLCARADAERLIAECPVSEI